MTPDNGAAERIALFGGTFDPVHEGHLEIARKAVDKLELDRVIFVPCRRSPHKTKEPGAPDADRLKMLELATEGLDWAKVTDYELEKPPPSYTWETVRHFKNKASEHTRFFLLIGFDQWEALPRWAHPERLAEDVEFIVVGRGDQATPRKGYRSHAIHGDHPASSTTIRRELLASQKPTWLPETVFEHIRKKGLYQATR